MTKTYIVKRIAAGTVTAIVTETADENNWLTENISYALEHLEHHSPDGFEFGYPGSGPSDLARSIVGDLTGTSQPHPAAYQPVKFALVATLDGDGPHEITEDAVRKVLAENGWDE